MTARRLTTDRLDLITATAQHLLVAQQDMGKLGRLLGADVAIGWPPQFLDAAALRYTLDQLHRGPDQIGWWMRYVVLRRGPGDRPVIVGTAGCKGAPKDGRLEVGYSIVDEFRNRGFATEATRALVDWGFDDDTVQEIVAETLPELGASIRVLEKAGFEHRGDGTEPGTIRYVKPRSAWLAEGPTSRRVPKLVPPGKDVLVAGIPPVAREVFDRFIAEPLRDGDSLRAEIREHVARIEAAAAANPYVDDVLARDIARVCEGLLDAVVDSTPDWTRRQIQAAARYFATEEDGDSDLSIGGLDEDAAVANAVAVHLGRGDLLSDLL
jgi:[ribosomal protein S5]-alanine N-acetyltransferase